MGITAFLGSTMAATAAMVGLVACQPVEAPPPRDPVTDAAAEPGAPGAPGTAGVPQELAALQARLETVAREWQEEPIIAEIDVELVDAAAWSHARVTYVAPDADRLLSVVLDADGMSQQRPTFATLGLEPVSAAGVEQIPDFPDAAQEPQDLAASAAPVLDGCGFDQTAASVLYASGAPVAWDGERWTEELAWTATVVSADDDAVLLDPVSGDPVGDGCLDG